MLNRILEVPLKASEENNNKELSDKLMVIKSQLEKQTEPSFQPIKQKQIENMSFFEQQSQHIKDLQDQLEESEGEESGEYESEEEEQEENFEHDDLLPIPGVNPDEMQDLNKDFEGASFLQDMQKLREMREKQMAILKKKMEHEGYQDATIPS